MWRTALIFALALFGAPTAADPTDVLIPSWVKVAVPAAMTSDDDEIVGYLIEQGMAPEAITWLKPTYGAQNIAVLKEPMAEGMARLTRLLEANYAPSGYGKEGDPCFFQAALSAPAEFAYRVYVAQKPGFGRTVIFWGPDPARQKRALERLLQNIAVDCSRHP